MIIDAFTALMRTEFLKAMQAVPDQEPEWKKFTQEVPSTARIENYAWMAPSPGIARYLGHRRYAQLDQIKYTVPNLEFDGSLTVATRDVEDDQIGGYQLRMKELGEKARIFPGVNVLQTLADAVKTGESGFDGTNFFATAHNVGTYPTIAGTGWGGGGNALTYTASGTSDGATNRCVFLIHNGALKPCLWQRRKGPAMNTTAGTPQSIEAKQANYFIDLEGAAAFGYWWDAISVVITNTPNITDIQTVFDKVMGTFFQYGLPAALASDPTLYVHQDLQFSPENTTIVCSTGLWALLRTALFSERLGVSVAGSTSGITNNIYYKMFGLLSTPYLN